MRPRPSGTKPKEMSGMEERYVLMSGTREFDDVIRGTAAECSMGYCEIMGHELRVERDEDGDWFYSLNTTGDEDDWERYDPVPCDGDREEALREGHKWFFLDYLNDGGQRRGKRPDNSPRGGGGGVPAGLRRAVGVHHGAGGPGPLPGPGRGVRDAALVSREPGQEEGGLGAQPWATTHHRKHDQPEGGSIVPPSGTDSKGGNDDGTERTCGEGQGPEGAQADGRGAGGGDSVSIEDDIKAEMTARGVSEMLVDVFKVRWTKVLSRRFDTTAFKAKYSELYEQHVKEVETRRFSVA